MNVATILSSAAAVMLCVLDAVAASSARGRLVDVLQHQDQNPGVNFDLGWPRVAQDQRRGQDVDPGSSHTLPGNSLGVFQVQRSSQVTNLGEYRPPSRPEYDIVKHQKREQIAILKDDLPGIFGGIAEMAERKQNSRRSYGTAQNQKPDVYRDEIPRNRDPNQGTTYNEHPPMPLAFDIRQDINQEQNTNFAGYRPDSRRGNRINHGREQDSKENPRRYRPHSPRLYYIIQERPSSDNANINGYIPISFGGIPQLQNNVADLSERRLFHAAQGQNPNQNVILERSHPFSSQRYDVLQDQKTRQNLSFDDYYPKMTGEYFPLQNGSKDDYSSGKRFFGIKENQNQEQTINFERFQPSYLRDHDIIQNHQDGKKINFNSYNPSIFGEIAPLQNHGTSLVGRGSFYSTQGQDQNPNVNYSGIHPFSRRSYRTNQRQLYGQNINFGDINTRNYKGTSYNSWRADKDQLHVTDFEKRPALWEPEISVPDQHHSPISESTGQLIGIDQNKKQNHVVDIGNYYHDHVSGASKQIQGQDDLFSIDTIPKVFVPTLTASNKPERSITDSTGYLPDTVENQKLDQGIINDENTSMVVRHEIKPEQDKYQETNIGEHPTLEENMPVFLPYQITDTVGTLVDNIQYQGANIGGYYPTPVDRVTKPVGDHDEVINFDTITTVLKSTITVPNNPDKNFSNSAEYILDITQNQKQNNNISIGEYTAKAIESAIKQDHGQYQVINIGKHPAIGEPMNPVQRKSENQEITDTDRRQFDIMQNQNQNGSINISCHYPNPIDSAVVSVRDQNEGADIDEISTAFIIQFPYQPGNRNTNSTGHLQDIAQNVKYNQGISIGENIARVLSHETRKDRDEYQVIDIDKRPSLEDSVSLYQPIQVTNTAGTLFDIIENQRVNMSGYYISPFDSATKPVRDQDDVVSIGTILPVFEPIIIVPNQTEKNITTSAGFILKISQTRNQNQSINNEEYTAKYIGRTIERDQDQYQETNNDKHPVLGEPMMSVPHQSANQVTGYGEQPFNIMQKLTKNQGANNNGYQSIPIDGATKPVQDETEKLNTGCREYTEKNPWSSATSTCEISRADTAPCTVVGGRRR